MKRLMIAAAIVCAAAFAQAAQFSWGLSNYEIASPTDEYDDGFGYVLPSAICSLYIGETLVASGTMEEDGTFGVTDNSAVDTTGSVQALAAGDISTSFAGQAYKLILETEDGAYQVVIDAVSTFKSVPQGVGQDDLNFENFTIDREIARGDWTAAVPEPTTGLLMLLGMGALALKRRRA